MAQHKHTPGPWTVGIGKTEIWGHDTKVATTDTNKIQANIYRTKDEEEKVANAELIAAAPELLEALEYLVHLHCCEQEGLSSGKPTFETWMNAVDKAQAAINKATNKTL